MRNKGKNVILIGFMGCGKTTVGMRLSYKLKTPVEDTDKLIEAAKGRAIRTIFAEEGEAAFREMETDMLRKIRGRKYGRILSVGGGTPVLEENRALLKECGTVIYLRATAETLYERLKYDETRPLLQCDNPKERIEELLASRKEAYEDCADYIVDVDGLAVEQVALQICKLVEAKKERRGMKLLVINGPNLNFLGIREKAVYGNQDYSFLLDMIAKKAKETDSEITVFQSNHEGAIIDRIQEAYFDGTQGIVINPGAYTHYSYAIHDALASVTTIPKVEIHISDITKREEFRKISVTKDACDHQIYGQGLDGYLQAIDYCLCKKM